MVTYKEHKKEHLNQATHPSVDHNYMMRRSDLKEGAVELYSRIFPMHGKYRAGSCSFAIMRTFGQKGHGRKQSKISSL